MANQPKVRFEGVCDHVDDAREVDERVATLLEEARTGDSGGEAALVLAGVVPLEVRVVRLVGDSVGGVWNSLGWFRVATMMSDDDD